MIVEINEMNKYVKQFIEKMETNKDYFDPMLSNQEQFNSNLIKPMKRKDDKVFGVYKNNSLIGLFSFLVIVDEKYMEMLVGLSMENEAYEEILNYLFDEYQGYNCDFVFNPKNSLIKKSLETKNADFDKEQIKMTYLSNVITSYSNKNIVAYEEKYFSDYNKIHSTDIYWTADKVVLAKEKFKVLLAINNAHVVGYIDFTYCFDENEPYDLFVLNDYRKLGYGEALLRTALEVNKNKAMMLLVDYDNIAAINLYKKVGFVISKEGSSVTAHLNLN